MRRIIIAILIVFLWVATAEAGLLNQYDSFKEFVDGLSVKHGVFYDYEASNWEHIVGASIYDWMLKDCTIASIDVAYMTQDIGLCIVDFNLAGLEAFGLSLPFGDLRPKIGVGAGYDFRHHDPVYGAALFGFTWGF